MNILNESNRLPNLNIKLIFAIIAMGILAMLFGLLAATANPAMIGLAMGMILGPALLLVPELAIWVILVMGLLMGVLSASPHFGKITWIISLLNMLLLTTLINAFLGKQKHLPGFMLIALVFLIYAVITSLIPLYSVTEFVAGFKRYFQSFGLMIALTLVAFTPQSFARWRKFLMVVALLQFPFALYELLILVPQRGGLSLSSATTDIVAGTFGANMLGGSPNSLMVIYLFIALAFLISRWRVGLIGNRVFYPLVLICLLPLGMGETKIAVVMLPLVGLTLLRKDFIRSPLRYIPAILTVGVLTVLLGYLYIVVIMNSSLTEVLNATIRYNAGNQGYSSGQYLNRLTSITFWIEQQSTYNPVSFLLGNGLGSSFTSTGELAGHMGLKYFNYGINLTAASTLLWDTGIIGLILFICIFIAAWVEANKLYLSVSDPMVKADILAIQSAISLFLLSVFYLDMIVNLLSMEIIYALVLGYLGYLINEHGTVRKHTASTESNHA